MHIYKLNKKKESRKTDTMIFKIAREKMALLSRKWKRKNKIE